MKKLFKFVSDQNAVLNISKGSLKFTPIDELNDPSELFCNIDHELVRDSLRLLRKSGISNEQFRWLQHQGATLSLLAPEEMVIPAPRTIEEANRLLSLSVYEHLGYMEEKLLATMNLIRSRVGILSLSERYDSLPMWAHYGNVGRGYVVEFGDLCKVFPGDETGSLNALKPVGYSDVNVGMTFDPCTQDSIFFSKFTDWSYEREWRVVTALSQCRKDEKTHLYLRGIDRRHVRAVICGWHISSSDISNLSSELLKINRDIVIYKSLLERGKISIEVFS